MAENEMQKSGDKELAIYVIYQREVTHAGTLTCEIQTITNFTGLMDRFLNKNLIPDKKP